MKDRILGSSTTIDIYGPSGPVPFMEVDSFDDEPNHELKNFHPLGQVEEHGQVIYKGYKLTFKGGKVDSSFENVQQALDLALLAGQAAPRYRVTKTTVLYDGTIEVWVFDNALIYNLKTSADNAEDEIKQEFTGWAPKKEAG